MSTEKTVTQFSRPATVSPLIWETLAGVCLEAELAFDQKYRAELKLLAKDFVNLPANTAIVVVIHPRLRIVLACTVYRQEDYTGLEGTTYAKSWYATKDELATYCLQVSASEALHHFFPKWRDNAQCIEAKRALNRAMASMSVGETATVHAEALVAGIDALNRLADECAHGVRFKPSASRLLLKASNVGLRLYDPRTCMMLTGLHPGWAPSPAPGEYLLETAWWAGVVTEADLRKYAEKHEIPLPSEEDIECPSLGLCTEYVEDAFRAVANRYEIRTTGERDVPWSTDPFEVLNIMTNDRN